MDASTEKHHARSLALLMPSFKMTILGFFIVASIFILNQIQLSALFPIKVVRIYGVNRISHQDIEDMLMPFIARGFFATQVDSIRDHLLQQPWVQDVSVRRAWPDAVDVSVQEKVPVAIWNDMSLLSTNGEVFVPGKNSFPQKLIHLTGPEGKQVEVLDELNDIQSVFSPIKTGISSFELTPYNTFKIKLENGLILQVGHKDILTRLKHFVKVYDKVIAGRVNDVEYVDLRYSNGVAVKWKT